MKPKGLSSAGPAVLLREAEGGGLQDRDLSALLSSSAPATTHVSTPDPSIVSIQLCFPRDETNSLSQLPLEKLIGKDPDWPGTGDYDKHWTNHSGRGE